ncbi:MAG: RNA polymerase sigma factor [Deltaproteobacteria bacterium]|nr:MAG: RNA polymerase sigma factor [Deltaproteobacteria bacterium]
MTRARPRPGDPPEESIQACRRGDRAALEAVLRAQLPALERLLARLVGPGADLEDLLQQTLIAAVAAFPTYRGEASIRTWLARIAVNAVRQHLRQPAVRRRAPLSVVDCDRAGPEPAPDRTSDRRRQLARVFHHLAAIGADKRIAFALVVIDGRGIEETAALMGASVSATKSRVYWARRELVRRARRDPLLRDLVEEEPA